MHCKWKFKGFFFGFCFTVLGFYTVQSGEIHDLMQLCPEGSFGYKCKYRCRCEHDESCDKVTGNCYNDCAQGFWGPGCQLSNTCFYNGEARHYQGRVNVTISLTTCQRWDKQLPYKHSYTDGDFPDNKIPDNFCRATKDWSRPWCYTTNPRTKWEHCNVNNCNCPTGRFGHNCDKECHCAESGEVCDSIMGICKSGCAPGWTGYDCQTLELCASNSYGWECSELCYCQNPNHCDRFTGPNQQCVCQKGFFNDPFCEPVTPPRIIAFSNNRVSQGQASVFNCTVAAFPTPRDDEIKLIAPIGKHVTLFTSVDLENYLYTRSNLFQVDTVNVDEKYSCVVRAISGETSITKAVDVYQRPMLVNPPRAVKENVTSSKILLEWLSWSPSRGDKGDPPALWYSVWLRTSSESSFRMVNYVLDIDCHERIFCNYTVTDLKPNIDYEIYITVRRQGEDLDGPPGPTIFVRTKCADPTKSPLIKSIAADYQVNNTYPKAKLTVYWEDAPEDTWSCNSITRYQIYVSKDEQDVQFTHVTVGAAKEFQIKELESAIRYCVSMRFENSKGYLSPTSAETCVITPAIVLSAPRNIQLIGQSSTSLTITWERPLNARDNVTTYTVIYWKGFLRELSTKKGLEWESADAVVEYTVTGLQSQTSYNIQVQAVNSAGSGEYSEILTATTSEGRPGLVAMFRNTSRTQTSIMLQWEMPAKSTGDIVFYFVKCTNVKSNLSDHVEPFRIPSSITSFNYTELQPSTQYACYINVSSVVGTGPSTALFVWTESVDPVEPPAPTILGRSESTVTIDIKPHSDATVSFFRIIVERVTDRKRRSVPDTTADYFIARRDELNVYVAAQLPNERAAGTFVVGDNHTYGGYLNVPLHPNIEYDIWLAAYAETDIGLRKSLSKAVKNYLDHNTYTVVAPPNHVPVIISVLIVFIVLILLVALLLVIWRQKHLQREREKADMPNFGPTIIPEPELTPPSTPIENIKSDPLLDASMVSDTDSEPVYGNIGFSVMPVKVEDLWDYVKNNKCNDCEGFRREYKLIPAGITALCEAAQKSENKSKNRYGNIVAYDHTRVVLHDYEEDHDDYINANYIDGYNKSRAYIAAQGPTKDTLKDIWRMVWQEQTKTVIMLTNPTETGKSKCEWYWPVDTSRKFHGISIECIGIHNLPDFTIRIFKLTKGEDSRTIKQFHYTTWPDHGVPKFSTSLLLMRQKIRTHDNLDGGPQVIHCSAGVGRTGSYIAIDVELERAKTEGVIDVHNYVQLMRTQRINMVQTLDQYVFVYDCLLEALISGDTLMRVDEYKDMLSQMCQFDNTIQKTKLEEQFDILRLVSTTIERDDSKAGLKADNIVKNRNCTIVPADRCRPYLMTPYVGCTEYINAVCTNSYTQRDGFIITQMPLPNTVIDFWRLIYDHNVGIVIMLNEIDSNDETCAQYWSMESGGECYGPFIVETTAEVKSDPSITVLDFSITNIQTPHFMSKVVRQFQFHRWADESPVPSSKLALFQLLDEVETCQKHNGNKSIIVHCMNGASRSGLYVAISVLIERLKLEKEIDVFQTIKQLRLCRSHLVDNLEQYRYCHEIVLDYINYVDLNKNKLTLPLQDRN